MLVGAHKLKVTVAIASVISNLQQTKRERREEGGGVHKQPTRRENCDVGLVHHAKPETAKECDLP